MTEINGGSSDKGSPLQTGFSFWYMRRGKGVNVASGANTVSTTEDPTAAATTTTTTTTPIQAQAGPNQMTTVTELESQPNTSSAVTTTTTTTNTTATGNTTVHPYENAVKLIATVTTVEEFWSVYDHFVRPHKLPQNVTTDYHFFRQGVKPTWEDPTNIHGGKWIVRLRKGLASRYWEEILLALIGSQFNTVPDGEVCGAVISVRHSEDIISVWNKNSQDSDVTDRLRDVIKRILQLPNYVHMEYKPHETSLHDKSSFRNTHVWKPSAASSGGGGSRNNSLIPSSLDTTGTTGNVNLDRTGGTTNMATTNTIHSSNNSSSNTVAAANTTTTTATHARRSGSWGEREDIRGVSASVPSSFPKTNKRSDSGRSWR